jgi:hypothetical protein
MPSPVLLMTDELSSQRKLSPSLAGAMSSTTFTGSDAT